MTRDNCATYSLHGLRVRSEVPLPALQTDARTIDLDVRWDRRPVTAGGSRGREVASVDLGNGRGYVLTRTRAGWTLRFHAIGEFRFDTALRRALVRLDPDGDPAMIPILLAGNVAAVVLSLGGTCVLHASAIEVDGAAFAFLGASGMGKSTVAALCAANGARLVTDDVLRVERTASGFDCVRGCSEVRLRDSAASVADRFAADVRRVTADRRIALRIARAAAARVPLRVLVVPQPTRGIDAVRVERVNRAGALYALMQYLRIAGWRTSSHRARQFAALSPLATAVPMYAAQIPWGPPFRSTLGGELLDRITARVHSDEYRHP